jgi:hypothetical protein
MQLDLAAPEILHPEHDPLNKIAQQGFALKDMVEDQALFSATATSMRGGW